MSPQLHLRKRTWLPLAQVLLSRLAREKTWRILHHRREKIEGHEVSHQIRRSFASLFEAIEAIFGHSERPQELEIQKYATQCWIDLGQPRRPLDDLYQPWVVAEDFE